MTATAFNSTLHAYMRDALRSCDRVHAEVQPQYIRELGEAGGRFIEATRRPGRGKGGPLDIEGYAGLVVELMGESGAPVEIQGIDPQGVRLVNRFCPFADRLGPSPRLCQLAFSLFAAIAARNFGYARARFSRCMMLGEDRCEMAIRTAPDDGIQPPAQERIAIEIATDLAGISTPGCMAYLWRPAPTADGVKKQAPEPVIVARSPAMRRALQAVETVGPTSATVLVTGETGVGKELIARALHWVGPRRERPFLAVNCGAIPETLIESTLFGHERGAFTGAHEARPGLFEQAGDGTLFLDEVNSLSGAAQKALLRVIQEGEYKRVGGRQLLQAKARIVAGANRPLAEEVRRGAFREDLFYRLDVVHLAIPPLRERTEDIPPLAEHILSRLRRVHGRDDLRIGAAAMDRLLRHPWPGNVRELENVLERSFLFSAGPALEVLLEHPRFSDPSRGTLPISTTTWRVYRNEAVCRMERDYLVSALERCGGDVRRVAECMEVTPRAVYMKMRLHMIDAAAYRG